MKSIVYLALFSALLLWSACKKDDESTPVDTNAMQFKVHGLGDVSMRKRDSTIFPISVEHTGGNQEKVELSIVGLPANIGYWFQISSGIPTFGTILTIRSAEAAYGDYPIKILATTASGTSKEFAINVNINTTGCVSDMAGEYSYKGCGQADYDRYAKSEFTYEAPNKLRCSMSGFGDIVLTVDCDTRQITGSSEVGDTTKITWTGSVVTSDVFQLNRKMVMPSSTHECTYTFKRD